MDLLWSYIRNSTVNDGWKLDENNNVVERGPHQQWSLYDTTGLFEKEVLIPAVNHYVEHWGFPLNCNTTHYPVPKFNRWWVRISKAGEYQPLHDHHSVWSFIIWMKIPFEHQDEQKDSLNELYPESGNMTICYLDSCGRLQKQPYRLGKKSEGTMLLFPSDLNHVVYPYHLSYGYRISIAGDVCVDSLNPGHPVASMQKTDIIYRNFPPTKD